MTFDEVQYGSVIICRIHSINPSAVIREVTKSLSFNFPKLTDIYHRINETDLKSSNNTIFITISKNVHSETFG